MKGGIFTKEKCPICKKSYQHQLDDLICPDHHTRPRRFYIQLYSRQLHKHINIHSNSRGQPFTSYEEADRLLTVIRNEIDSHGDFDPTRYVAQKLKPLRFSNWSKAWLEEKKKEVELGRLSPSYLRLLGFYVEKYQAFFLDMDIREIKAKQIKAFYLSLDCSPKYAMGIMSALHKMFHDAKTTEDIKGELPAFPSFEVPETEIKTIDLDEQDKIINAIKDPMDRTFMLFTAREMVRPSETRALQWDDIDLKHDRITIRRHFSLNVIRPATKAKQIKVLPLDREVKYALQSIPRHITSPFVFWKGVMGKPFYESRARKLWKRVCLGLGVKISLYQGTRHSSATEAVNRVGMDAIQEFLYHTNREMTKRYAKVNPDGLKKVLREK